MIKFFSEILIFDILYFIFNFELYFHSMKQYKPAIIFE